MLLLLCCDNLCVFSHSITEDSYHAEREETRLRPATSNQGFTSVSLRVPSYDPLPSDDPPTDPRAVKSNIQPPTNDPYAYDIIEVDNTANSGDRIQIRDERRRIEGVALNPDNRTDPRAAINPYNDTIPRETSTTRSDGAGATLPSTNPLQQHEYINTSLSSQQKIHIKESSLPGSKAPPKPSNGEGEQPMDEDGYDTIERERNLEDQQQHKYDIVLLDQENIDSEPVEHKYRVLESEKERLKNYSITQTHILVVPNDQQEKSKSPVSDERAVVVEAGGHRGLQSSLSLKYSSHSPNSNGSTTRPPTSGAQKPRKVDPGYHEPWLSRQPPPRRITYSSSQSNSTVTTTPAESSAPPKNKKLFDDPAYDLVTLSGSTKIVSNVSKVPQPASTEASADSATPHSCTQSLKQGKKEKAQRYDYEFTADIGTGEISEPEPAMMLTGGNVKEDTTKSLPTPPLRKGDDEGSATPLSTAQSSIAPPRNPYKFTPKPNPPASRGIYEEHPLDLNKAPPNPRDIQYEMASLPAPTSRAAYESTSLKQQAPKATPKSMFDDPMYDFGMNLKSN